MIYAASVWAVHSYRNGDIAEHFTGVWFLSAPDVEHFREFVTKALSVQYEGHCGAITFGPIAERWSDVNG